MMTMFRQCWQFNLWPRCVNRRQHLWLGQIIHNMCRLCWQFDATRSQIDVVTCFHNFTASSCLRDHVKLTTFVGNVDNLTQRGHDLMWSTCFDNVTASCQIVRGTVVHQIICLAASNWQHLLVMLAIWRNAVINWGGHMFSQFYRVKLLSRPCQKVQILSICAFLCYVDNLTHHGCKLMGSTCVDNLMRCSNNYCHVKLSRRPYQIEQHL